MSLEGRVALVTGTGPNIGSGLALMLAKYGAKVACIDVRPEAVSLEKGEPWDGWKAR